MSQALKCPPKGRLPPAARRLLKKRWQLEGPVRGPLSLETPINLLWPQKWDTATQPLERLHRTHGACSLVPSQSRLPGGKGNPVEMERQAAAGQQRKRDHPCKGLKAKKRGLANTKECRDSWSREEGAGDRAVGGDFTRPGRSPTAMYQGLAARDAG